MSLSETLSKRGFIKDKTFSDLKFLDKPQAFYFGVDCSADSLHIGNLAGLMLARHLLEAGWQATLLVGGATSLIGDPGGKDEERPLLARETVLKNTAAIKKQIANLFASGQFESVDNHDWFTHLSYLDFLRDVGKHFAMSELVQREFITERMREGGSGISYAEFSYSLIQGYDYWHLYKSKNVTLQIGGSDQWGNMLSGVSLIRKKEGQQAHALSMPLVVNKTTGKKFGKTEAGAIWLDPAKTSPTEFYQFWINVDDADVGDYLKIFTLLPLEQIKKTMEYHASSPEERKAQLLLARQVTELVHGREQAHTVQVVTQVLTGAIAPNEVSAGILEQLKAEIAHVKIKKSDSLQDVLVATGLASSKSEASRLIGAGAVYLNGQKIDDASDIASGASLLRRGKAYKDSALIIKN